MGPSEDSVVAASGSKVKEDDANAASQNHNHVSADESKTPRKSVGKLGKPGKPFKDMTPEEKKSWRAKQKLWTKERRAEKQRELKDSHRFNSTPIHSTDNFSRDSETEKKDIMKEMKKLVMEMENLASSPSSNSQNTTTETNKKPRALESGKQEDPVAPPLKHAREAIGASKRNREERSDEHSSMEKPVTKKMKRSSLYKEATPLHYEIYIRKIIHDKPFAREDISSLAKQLQAAVVKICLEGNSEGNAKPPIITANFPTREGYCVVCGDMQTLKWIKRDFREIFWKTTDICLVDEENLKGKHAATIFLPEPRMELVPLLKVIDGLNPGLITKNWWIKGITKHKDGSSILHVLVEEAQKKLMEDRKNLILTGIAIATVRFRKEDTEEGMEDILNMETDTEDNILDTA